MASTTLADDPIVLAAVLRFAREGFDAPLRGIAADAGVSAALIMKRFGSKDGLRQAADEFVRAWIRRAKDEHADAAATGQLLMALAQSEEHATLVVYIFHAILDGDAIGRDFVEGLIDDAERAASSAVERGELKPSRDERARARYLTLSSVGAFLLSLLLRPADDGGDLASVSRRLVDESSLPMLELYTEGFLTSRDALDGRLGRAS
ncbi:MAG TPA: TetR family transcriptional regulator [Microbacterium sp.]|nr:TetR family transcriptional regulator [Microbacterium sp.]